jgi:hypothetical protein
MVVWTRNLFFPKNYSTSRGIETNRPPPPADFNLPRKENFFSIEFLPPSTSDIAIAHHGVLMPGTSFLQKPFTAESLSQKIREVLEQ